MLAVVGPDGEVGRAELGGRDTGDRAGGVVEGEPGGHGRSDLPGPHVPAVLDRREGGVGDVDRQGQRGAGVAEEYLGVVDHVVRVAHPVPVRVGRVVGLVQRVGGAGGLVGVGPPVPVIVLVGLVGGPVAVGVEQGRGDVQPERGGVTGVIGPDGEGSGGECGRRGSRDHPGCVVQGEPGGHARSDLPAGDVPSRGYGGQGYHAQVDCQVQCRYIVCQGYR